MTPAAEHVSRILESNTRIGVAITGGGMATIPRLLAVPGASRVIVEACVPYSEQSLAEYLGQVPEQFCSEETALAMAAVARRRAARHTMTSPEAFPVGVGVTAALASDRPKRGPHRAYVAVDSPFATSCHSLVLEKGARHRAEEDALVSDWVISALAMEMASSTNPCSLSRNRLQIESHEVFATGTDRIHRQRVQVPSPLSALATGGNAVAWRQVSGEWSHELPVAPPRGLLCGSFNPPHDGHRLLRRVAEHRLGGPVAWEFSLENVQKPPLDFLRLARRVEWIAEGLVAVTRPALFAEKGACFPGATFVIGYDTALRLLDPKLHGGSWEGVLQALDTVRRNGNRFLVAGRKIERGFRSGANFAGPEEFADLFDFLDEAEFRVDVSSTELRRQARVGERAANGDDPADE